MPLTREELQNISKMKKNLQFPTLILDFEKTKLYKSCQNCNKTNFITCENVIICKYCCIPYGYIFKKN